MSAGSASPDDLEQFERRTFELSALATLSGVPQVHSLGHAYVLVHSRACLSHPVYNPYRISTQQCVYKECIFMSLLLQFRSYSRFVATAQASAQVASAQPHAPTAAAVQEHAVHKHKPFQVAEPPSHFTGDYPGGDDRAGHHFHIHTQLAQV